MTSPYLSLVAPCLNEEKNVVELCERFLSVAHAKKISVEIVFVDDGSTDNTWMILGKLQDQYGDEVRLVRHSTNRGIPQGWISGVEGSTGEVVCLIDSDLQNPPEAVFDLLAAYDPIRVDVVRGVRRPSAKQPKSRLFFSRSLNFLLNGIFGMNSEDNKSGFVLANRDTMMQLVHHQGHYNHYQTFIGVAAHTKLMRVEEVPTLFHDRRAGVSFLSGRSMRVIREVYQDIPNACKEFGWRFGRKDDK